MNRSLTREQTTTIVQGILCLVLFIVLLQVWLLSATTHAWLGGDDSVLWPAAAASANSPIAGRPGFRFSSYASATGPQSRATLPALP